MVGARGPSEGGLEVNKWDCKEESRNIGKEKEQKGQKERDFGIDRIDGRTGRLEEEEERTGWWEVLQFKP